MSFSALLCAQFRPVGEWRRSTVDDILVEDDKMYLNAIESRAIADEQTISLNYLPNTICSHFLSDSSLVSNQLSLGTTNTSELPNRQNQNAQSNIDLPIVETTNTNQLPNWQNETSQSNMISPASPIVATNIDQSVIINYKDFYQGRIANSEHENEAPYLSPHSALMNTLSENNYAFIILDSYIMALIESVDCIYVFASHAFLDCFGMPNPKGTAVVIKCPESIFLKLYQLNFIKS